VDDEDERAWRVRQPDWRNLNETVHQNSDAISYSSQKTQPIKFARLCSGADLCNESSGASPFTHI
jgi:hypothetical protein